MCSNNGLGDTESKKQTEYCIKNGLVVLPIAASLVKFKQRAGNLCLPSQDAVSEKKKRRENGLSQRPCLFLSQGIQVSLVHFPGQG